MTVDLKTHAEETLAAWQAEELRIKSTGGKPGVARLDQVAGKTGLEIFDAMLAGELPYPPISETLDFFLVEKAFGRAVFQGKPSLKHYNPLGTVHGGWYCTLLDSALGCAVHTTMPAGRSYTTLEIKVNMVRALSVKVPLVRAEGKVVHSGRQSATAEGRLYDAAGKLYAHASTTCLVFDLPK
jgi:uncharacterized protein (TIGR00369 family)